MQEINFLITSHLNEVMNSTEGMQEAINKAVERFINCDWGNVPAEDKRANDSDLRARDGHLNNVRS